MTHMINNKPALAGMCQERALLTSWYVNQWDTDQLSCM